MKPVLQVQQVQPEILVQLVQLALQEKEVQVVEMDQVAQQAPQVKPVLQVQRELQVKLAQLV